MSHRAGEETEVQRVNGVIRQGAGRGSEPRASNAITLGQDRVNCSGCLSLLLSASPHQVPEQKPGLLPRPWGIFSSKGSHVHRTQAQSSKGGPQPLGDRHTPFSPCL